MGAIGKEAVLRGLVKAGGAKVVEDDVRRAREMGIDTKGLEDAMMVSSPFFCFYSCACFSLNLRPLFGVFLSL